MNTTGIGQSVRRVEDFRFLTGNGQYVADINRPAQSYAVFVRSPHAHAAIRTIDTGKAAKAPGVLGVFTGKQTRRGQDRRADLRLDDPLQGRIAHEGGSASRARAR